MKKQKNPILASIKELPKLIKKHKSLILTIFLLQIIFFSILFFINIKYQTRIYESVTNVLDYLENQQLGEEAVGVSLLTQQNILGEDPLMIYKNYRTIINSIILLLIFIFLTFAIINGLNWSLTDQLINKKKAKSFIIYFGKFKMLTLAYSILIILSLYSLFRSSIIAVSTDNITISSFLPLLPIIIILYFAFISFALTGNDNLKGILKKTFLIGTKKAHIMALTYLITLLIIAFFSLLLFLSINLHILILVIAMILFVSSFVLARTFFLLVVNKL